MNKTLLVLVAIALAAGLAVLLLAPSIGAPDAAVVDAGPRDSAAFPTVDGTVDDGEYAGVVSLVGADVHWANDATTLRVALVCPGTGYVAIGIDPQTMMQGANYLLGAAVDGGVVVRDDVGTGLVSHAADVDRGGSDNILAAAGREADGKTTVEFAIPLDSGDPHDRPLAPGQRVKILVAYHDSDDSFSARHTRRASGEIVLQAAP